MTNLQEPRLTRGVERPRVIRDPVHGYIDLPPELFGLIDYPMVQRLRGISQTATCSSVFPAMTGSRFEHALGTMHLARREWSFAWQNSIEHQKAFLATIYADLHQRKKEGKFLDAFTEQWIGDQKTFVAGADRTLMLVAMTIGLLHDIGHPPFSHSLEGFYERHLQQITADCPEFLAKEWPRLRAAGPFRPFHEIIGQYLVERIPPQVMPRVPLAVVQIVLAASPHERTWAACLKQVVSNDVDVDRIDYLLRDAQKSGTEFGAIDSERLLSSAELHRNDDGWELGFGVRALSAIEQFLIQRVQYYRWVIFHPHCVAENRLMNLAMESMAKTEQPFAGWLGELNYFANDSNSPDRATLYDLAERDDSTVTTLLRNARKSVTHATGRDPEASSLRAMLEAILYRSPVWAAIWKTDFDYELIAKEVAPALREELGVWEERILDEVSTIDEPTSPHASALLRKHLRAGNIRTNLQDDPIAGLNQVVREMIGNTSSRRGLGRENELANELSHFTGEIDTRLKDGYWLVAYQAFDPISENDDHGVAIWDADARRTPSEVSPIVQTLVWANQMKRPQFYVYYVSRNATLRLRKGRTSLFKTEIMNAFIEAFAKAAANYLMKLPV